MEIDELFNCLKWNQVLVSIDNELQSIDEQFIPKSPNWNGVGGGSVQTLDYRRAEAITRKQELLKQRESIIELLNHFDKLIYQLPDAMSCRILHLRFIAINYNHRVPKPYTLEEIADIIGYSYRGLYKKYKKALNLFIEVHNKKVI